MNTIGWATAAVIAQIVLTVYFAVTYWISLPPFNHLAEDAFANERRINLSLYVIQLISIAGFFYQIT